MENHGPLFFRLESRIKKPQSKRETINNDDNSRTNSSPNILELPLYEENDTIDSAINSCNGDQMVNNGSIQIGAVDCKSIMENFQYQMNGIFDPEQCPIGNNSENSTIPGNRVLDKVEEISHFEHCPVDNNGGKSIIPENLILDEGEKIFHPKNCSFGNDSGDSITLNTQVIDEVKEISHPEHFLIDNNGGNSIIPENLILDEREEIFHPKNCSFGNDNGDLITLDTQVIDEVKEISHSEHCLIDNDGGNLIISDNQIFDDVEEISHHQINPLSNDYGDSIAPDTHGIDKVEEISHPKHSPIDSDSKRPIITDNQSIDEITGNSESDVAIRNKGSESNLGGPTLPDKDDDYEIVVQVDSHVEPVRILVKDKKIGEKLEQFIRLFGFEKYAFDDVQSNDVKVTTNEVLEPEKTEPPKRITYDREFLLKSRTTFTLMNIQDSRVIHDLMERRLNLFRFK